ncbi:MAG: hypothetical protein M0C28_16800 [Candidatus Moduliflexus flocculans]|nr:hypothetical protein [Candidatus Moduliflexus flocculans]
MNRTRRSLPSAARAAEERDQLDHVDEQIGTWEEELRRVEDRQKALAGDVSRRRRERADVLGEMVLRELRELGLQQGRFSGPYLDEGHYRRDGAG